jgi:hypothetical protein
MSAPEQWCVVVYSDLPGPGGRVDYVRGPMDDREHAENECNLVELAYGREARIFQLEAPEEEAP